MRRGLSSRSWDPEGRNSCCVNVWLDLELLPFNNALQIEVLEELTDLKVRRRWAGRQSHSWFTQQRQGDGIMVHEQFHHMKSGTLKE